MFENEPLSGEALVLVIRRLAAFRDAEDIIAELEALGVTASRIQIMRCDPTGLGYNMAPELIATFYAAREEFHRAPPDVPIASKAWRLEQLQRMHDAVVAEQPKNPYLARLLLEYAEREVEPRDAKRQPSPRLRWAILSRDNHTCRGCGRTPADGVVLEVDHIVPWSRGGRTVAANLQTLCWECNAGKSNREHSNNSQAD